MRNFLTIPNPPQIKSERLEERIAKGGIAAIKNQGFFVVPEFVVPKFVKPVSPSESSPKMELKK